MTDLNLSSHQIQANVSKAQQASLLQTEIALDEAATEFKESLEVAFNPVAMRSRFDTLEARVRRKPKEEESGKTEKVDEADFQIEGATEVSESFEQKNPELQAKALLSLRSRLSKNSTVEQLLETVLEAYPDPSLADETLDFLIQTSEPELAEKLILAKNRLNAEQGRQVIAGKNIMQEAQAFSKEGLGTPTNLRDLYRDITGTPRDASTLFAELAIKYTYAKMKTVIAFILHSLGQDLRAKGPSIERGELFRLVTEAKSMQAILGVYHFFQSRQKLVASTFARHGLTLSSRITFETLAKAFMKIVLERYPSSDKVLKVAAELGLEDELLGEVIIFSQMKDAIRQVSMRLFRSDQHKQDLLATFLDTLEELEEELDKEEEEEEDEDEDDESV